METLRLFNGNNQEMIKNLPQLFIHGEINEVALQHIKDNTGLVFNTMYGGLIAQPTTSDQIVRLFLTYNFKTRYFDNLSVRNTIHLKFDHHVGFDVNSVCFQCVKRNNLHIGDLKDGDFLAC